MPDYEQIGKQIIQELRATLKGQGTEMNRVRLRLCHGGNTWRPVGRSRRRRRRPSTRWRSPRRSDSQFRKRGSNSISLSERPQRSNAGGRDR